MSKAAFHPKTPGLGHRGALPSDRLPASPAFPHPSHDSQPAAKLLESCWNPRSHLAFPLSPGFWSQRMEKTKQNQPSSQRARGTDTVVTPCC